MTNPQDNRAANYIASLRNTTAREENIAIMARRTRGYGDIANDALNDVLTRASTVAQRVYGKMENNPFFAVDNEAATSIGDIIGGATQTVRDLRKGFPCPADYYAYVRMTKQSEEVALAQIHSAIGDSGHMCQSHVAERSAEVRVTGMKNIEALFLELAEAKILYTGGDFVMFSELNVPACHVDTNRLELNLKHTGREVLSFCYRFVRSADEAYPIKFTEILKKYLDTTLSVTGSYTVIKGIQESGTLDLMEDTKLSEAKMPIQEFYPTIDIPLIDYWREFMMSDANVLIIYGPPGTGKSTFTRGMVGALGLRALATANPAVFLNPNFVSVCGSTLSGQDGKYDLLVAEEAKDLIRHRVNPDPEKPGNPLVNALLDALDGASRVNSFKLVITMNAEDLSEVDAAFLRPNRTFDALYLGHLTPPECVTIRRKLGKVPREYGTGKRQCYVLSEVVTDENYKTSIDAKGQVTVEPRFKPRRLK